MSACPAGLIFHEGGTFWMGSNDGDVNERPVRKVTVAPFCLSPREARDPARTPAVIVNVTWAEARATCMSRGRRLATEAEWEFAARGAEGRKYPWGEAEPTCAHANSKGCRHAVSDETAAAGATPAGVLDLAGNAWEWVEDCYRSPGEGRPGDSGACSHRVLRGGSWKTRPSTLRGSAREIGDPDVRSDQVGFRCAAAPIRGP